MRTSHSGFLGAAVAAVAVLTLLPADVEATVTRPLGPFDATFYHSGESDGTYTGRKDWTQQEMDDVAAGAAAWIERIANTPGRRIAVHMFWADDLGPRVLGQTYGPSNGDGTTSWSYVEHVWRDGANYLGNWRQWDASIQFDVHAAGTPGGWNFGVGAPGPDQIDFRSVVAHETGHGVGFAATYYADFDLWGGSLGTATDPYGFAGFNGLMRWDQNLVDPAGNRPVTGGSGTPGNFDECGDPVWFTGANAVACYGGNVPVYAPWFHQTGSSLMHVDQDLLPDALMAPMIGEGEMVRKPTRLELEMAKDIGWSILTTRTWSHGAGTPNWDDADNWGPTGTPDETWDVAFTNAGIANGDVINLGADRKAYALRLDTGVDFTIGRSDGTLTLATGRITRAASSSGTQTIAGPVVLDTDGTWDIAGTGRLVVSGVATLGPRTIEKRGPGILTLSGSQTYAAGSTFTVEGGIAEFNTDAGGFALTVNVNGSAAHFGSTQHLQALNVNTGTSQLTAGGAKVLVVKGLSIDAGDSVLDLTDNTLLVDYAGGPSPFDAIHGYLAAGCNGGSWNGLGITSSAAAAHPQAAAALGVLDDGATVTVDYTWAGDANLDGVVDSNDYDRIDTAWALLTGEGIVPVGGFRWAVGDFTYDNMIDSNDYDLIDRAWALPEGTPFGGAAPVPTPEPATLALLAVGGMALLLHRRK